MRWIVVIAMLLWPAVAGAQRGQSDRFFLVFKKPVDAK